MRSNRIDEALYGRKYSLVKEKNTLIPNLNPYGIELLLTFDYPGIMHNMGLDFLVNELSQKIGRFSSEKDVKAELIRLTEKFVISKRLYDLKMPLDLTRFGKDNLFSVDEMVRELENSSIDGRWFRELSTICLSSESIEKKIEQIRRLEQLSANSMTSNGDFAALAPSLAYSVARNSLEYWTTNSSKWLKVAETVFPPRPNPVVSGRFNWSGIALGDAFGAARGVIQLGVSGTGAALAAGGPPGWVAGGLVVAANAIGGSATTFVIQYYTNP